MNSSAAPLHRRAFAALRRRRSVAGALAPHWGALLAIGLFLVAGLSALDNYGVTWDESLHRDVWLETARYIQGEDAALPSHKHKFYGTAFQAPLGLAERAFGLEDERGVYLSRHLLTRLFFLTGGLFAYLLALRLLRNRLLALMAAAVFLLHPRLYAHSFFNSSDLPFAAAFMAALYLTHRAFKRGGISDFVLLGAAVGALVNLRAMGLILAASIPAMRALDLVAAQGSDERKRALATSAAFALAFALAFYALLPYLWESPIDRLVRWWTLFSNHPHVPRELFRGALHQAVNLPVEYLPVWFSITSPPFALLLGAVGAGGALAGGVMAPLRALRNTRLRFALMLTAAFALPVLALMIWRFNAYDGWRHWQFLWAPFALLAVFGLRQLASALGRPRLRTAVYASAGAGLAATALSMALIHPNEHVYFNLFVDRATPERLRTQYEMDYWGHPIRQALEWALDQSPSGLVKVNLASPSAEHLLPENAAILPEPSRARVSLSSDLDAYTIAVLEEAGEAPSLTRGGIHVYGSAIATIERKDALQTAYAAAARSAPLAQAAFDVYYESAALLYVREPCAQADAENPFFLHVFPKRAEDLPERRRAYGFDNRDFNFLRRGAEIEGKCLAMAALPDYPVASVRTGQHISRERETWGVAIDLAGPRE